jgi:hypothetical protein
VSCPAVGRDDRADGQDEAARARDEDGAAEWRGARVVAQRGRHRDRAADRPEDARRGDQREQRGEHGGDRRRAAREARRRVEDADGAAEGGAAQVGEHAGRQVGALDGRLEDLRHAHRYKREGVHEERDRHAGRHRGDEHDLEAGPLASPADRDARHLGLRLGLAREDRADEPGRQAARHERGDGERGAGLVLGVGVDADRGEQRRGQRRQRGARPRGGEREVAQARSPSDLPDVPAGGEQGAEQVIALGLRDGALERRPSRWTARIVSRPAAVAPGSAAAAVPSRRRSAPVSASRPAAALEWSVSSTAAPPSRRSASSPASQARPSSSRPENGSSSSSSGQPACSASSSATRWSMPRLRVAAGRSSTAGSRPLASAAVGQSVAVRPRSARIDRSHSPQRSARARRTFSGTNAHAPWRRSVPARGAARPTRTRSRLVLPLPFAPARWTACPESSVRPTPDSTVRRPRRTVSAPASSKTGTPSSYTPG